MIANRREFTMAMIILGVLLGGLAFLLAVPMIQQARQAAETRQRMERDRSVAERLINARGDWEAKLNESRATLPRYSMTETVGAELLRQVRRLADENGLITTRITPDIEQNIGDLYEQAIEVTWEGRLEPLVKFLYAVQIAGATLDIRQMTMQPAQGELLKGNLKIFFAYQRTDAPPESPAEATVEMTPESAIETP